MSRYAKSISAFLTALAAWGVTAAADNGFTLVELFGLALVINAAVVVWAIPNTPPTGQPSDPTISETDPPADPSPVKEPAADRAASTPRKRTTK